MRLVFDKGLECHFLAFPSKHLTFATQSSIYCGENQDNMGQRVVFAFAQGESGSHPVSNRSA